MAALSVFFGLPGVQSSRELCAMTMTQRAIATFSAHPLLLSAVPITSGQSTSKHSISPRLLQHYDVLLTIVEMLDIKSIVFLSMVSTDIVLG